MYHRFLGIERPEGKPPVAVMQLDGAAFAPDGGVYRQGADEIRGALPTMRLIEMDTGAHEAALAALGGGA